MEHEVPFICDEESGQWITPEKIDMSIGCQHICKEKCHNGGKCIGNDKCECPKGFDGERCEKKSCTELPSSINAGIHIM